MKRLSNLLYLCIVLVMIASCEQETIEGNALLQEEELTISNTIGSGIDINASRDFASKNANNAKESTFSAKSNAKDSGFTYYLDSEEFDSNGCNDLVLEDFDYDSGVYTQFGNPLDESTSNDAYSPGDIVSGISISSSQESNPNHPNQLLVLRGNNVNMVSANWWQDGTVINFLDGATDISFELYGGNNYYSGNYYFESDTEIKVYSGEELVDVITVYDVKNSFGDDNTFFGIRSDVLITKIIIKDIEFPNVELISNIKFGSCDADEDGCPDYKDAHKYSDLRETIVIDGCDTEVENVFSDCGTTIMDEINDLIAEVSAESYKYRRPWERPYDSQKAFKRKMTFLATIWASKGFISWSEASDILKCLESSNIDFEGSIPD